MEDFVSSLFTKFVIFQICLTIVYAQYGQIPDSVIVLQNQYGECSSIWNPRNHTLQNRDIYQVISQTSDWDFYQPDRNCVVVLIGKVGWQWSIRITKFDVAGVTNAEGIPKKCGDFVKIYDAERCDNAKLVKGINYKTGLCGTLSESQVGNVQFTSCANKITIQFKTDIVREFRRGFSMELVQYPWSNPTGGPDCDPSLNGIAPGVWRDGTFTEFQNTWSDQPVIPGYVPLGTVPDYDKEEGGITCYECESCSVDPFDPDREGAAVETHCYRCSKEWDEEWYIASRKCYTRSQYHNKLLSLRDIDQPFVGCKQTVTDFGRTMNYCFCDRNHCNKGIPVICDYMAMLLALLAVWITR